MINEGRRCSISASIPPPILHVGHFMALCLDESVGDGGQPAHRPSSEAVPVWWVTPPAAPDMRP